MRRCYDLLPFLSCGGGGLARTPLRALRADRCCAAGDASLAHALSRRDLRGALVFFSRFARSRLPRDAVVSARPPPPPRARSARSSPVRPPRRARDVFAIGRRRARARPGGERRVAVDRLRQGVPSRMTDPVRALHDANLTPAEILERERRGDPILSPPSPCSPHPRAAQPVCAGKNYLEHVGEVDTNLPASARRRPLRPHHLHQGAHLRCRPPRRHHLPHRRHQRGGLRGRTRRRHRPPASYLEEDALDHVRYTVVNDITARDAETTSAVVPARASTRSA